MLCSILSFVVARLVGISWLGDWDHRNSPHHTFVAMHFVFLEFFPFLIAAFNLTFAWKVKVDRQLNGIDHFELLDDDKNSICTTAEKAMEFCAKHGAVMVRNTRICLDDQQSLYCRCNSTKSTFLLHEERCVVEENVPRHLPIGPFPGRVWLNIITIIFMEEKSPFFYVKNHAFDFVK